MITNDDLKELIEEKSKGLKISDFVKHQLSDGDKDFRYKMFKIISGVRENTFATTNPENIKYIRLGNPNASFQNLYLKFDNDKKILKDVVTNRLNKNKGRSKTMDKVKVKNHTEFIRQFFNLMYLCCGELSEGQHKKGCPIIIKLKDGRVFQVTSAKGYSEDLRGFACVYFRYHINIFDNKIPQKNRKKRLNEIINQSPIRKKLYEHLKIFFNDFDFIYSIMAHLTTEERTKKFLLLLEKNEGCMSHLPMETVNVYASEAYYLNRFSDSFKPKFIKDKIAEYMKDDTAKKLYDMLAKIVKKGAEDILLFLETEEERQKMTEFLETGETDGDKIIHYMVEIKRNNTNQVRSGL